MSISSVVSLHCLDLGATISAEFDPSLTTSAFCNTLSLCFVFEIFRWISFIICGDKQPAFELLIKAHYLSALVNLLWAIADIGLEFVLLIDIQIWLDCFLPIDYTSLRSLKTNELSESNTQDKYKIASLIRKKVVSTPLIDKNISLTFLHCLTIHNWHASSVSLPCHKYALLLYCMQYFEHFWRRRI